MECVGDGVAVEDLTSGTKLRHQLHRMQPLLVVVDERAGRTWRAISAVPRIHLVRSQPRVIALLEKIDQRRERLAAMAGCYDAVDLSRSSWPDDLREAVWLAGQDDAADLPVVTTGQG